MKLASVQARYEPIPEALANQPESAVSQESQPSILSAFLSLKISLSPFPTGVGS
ncbi:hypothetical protein H6F74_12585 [Trichocoleus sp. FACHB-90]|uniref:hypothetical protein n=1 Tax=Funiculus sociatus TaxID=450527 RepID=UPI001997977F|nr:hypothetical protein [Trichocoleus sp. FACHB-90]